MSKLLAITTWLGCRSYPSTIGSSNATFGDGVVLL